MLPKKVNKANLQVNVRLCKNHVDSPTHITSDTSSADSDFDQVSSDNAWATINFLLHIRRNQKSSTTNSGLADEVLKTTKRLFKEGQIQDCLDDLASGYRMLTDNSAFSSSWPRSGNDYVVTSADMLSPVENMSKNNTLRADYRKIGENENARLCTALAIYGTLPIAITESNHSPPPIIADLVPGHNQIVKFDCSSGSSSIDI